MRGVFEEAEPERGKAPQRDRELTLGSGALLGIFFGMVLLCGLFFGLGFAVGRYGSADQAPQQAGILQKAASAVSAKAKPSAAAQSAPQPQSVPAQNGPPQQASNAGAPAAASAETSVMAASRPAGSQTGSAAGEVNAKSEQQVKPALPAMQAVTASVAPQQTVQPAMAPVNGPRVQVAVVSHQEDADVLVRALSKRGYSVSARRRPTDTMIHVEVGPFGSWDEANRWKEKLLNDGYNALVVQ